MEVMMLEPTMFCIIAKAENDEIQKKAEGNIVYKSQQTGNSGDRNIKLVFGLVFSGAIRSLLMWLMMT
jgi:hypothetical protein